MMSNDVSCATVINKDTENHWCPDRIYLEQLKRSNDEFGWTFTGREDESTYGFQAFFERLNPQYNITVIKILTHGLGGKEIAHDNNEVMQELRTCRIINADNTLSQYGRIFTLLQLPLEEQASYLGLPISVITIPKNESVEIDALNHFRLLGFEGSSKEGSVVLTILKSLCFDLLCQIRPAWDTGRVDPQEKIEKDAALHYFEGQLVQCHGLRENLINEIRSCTISKLLNNFSKIYTHDRYRETFPDLTEAIIEGAYAALGKDRTIAILEVMLKNPYLFRKGWPDLTLFRDGEIQFVEVKAKDKLHVSQLVTILAMQNATRLPFSILAVKRPRRNSQNM